MISSANFAWKRDLRPYYESDLAFVDVNAYKDILACSNFPVEAFDLAEVKDVDTQKCEIVFRNGGVRSLDPERLKSVNLEVPILSGFVPAEVYQNGQVFWGFDVIDGFHRIAAAWHNRVEALPMVRLPAFAAVGLVRPRPHAMGMMFRDPNVRIRNSIAYWTLLERSRGCLFGTSGAELYHRAHHLARSFQLIGAVREVV